MKVKRLPIDTFSPSEYNPRKDLLPGDREYVEIERSLDEFGLVEPLVGNEATGHLVGGHQRLKILKAKGETHAWFSLVNEPDESREKALNVRLNGSQGAWDVDRLEQLLAEDTTLQDLAGISVDDLAELRALTERDDALGMLARTAAAREAAGDKPQNEPKDLGADVSDLTIPVSREQRRKILDGVARAKELWGHVTTAEALADICDFFTSKAQDGAPI